MAKKKQNVELNPGLASLAQVKDHTVFNDILEISEYDNMKFERTLHNGVYIKKDNYELHGTIIFSMFKDIEFKAIHKTFIAGAARRFYKYYHIENVYRKTDYNVRGALLKGVDGTLETQCWSYDMNGARLYALLQPIPNVNEELGPGLVEEGMVGFTIDYETGQLKEIREGVADVQRFKLMESPYDGYVDELMKMDKETRKNNYTVAIGCMRDKNPFLWTHILTVEEENISKYQDEDTIMINTDAIYSRRPRPDIPLGANLGQFKEEFKGETVFFKGHNYQCEVNGKAAIRGIPKALQNSYSLKKGKLFKQPTYVWDGISLSERPRDEIIETNLEEMF